MSNVSIQTLSPTDLLDRVAELNRILIDSVEQGAAIGFIHPLSGSAATAFWQETVAPELATTRRTMFVAELSGSMVGTVQLITAMPPNQPHRCEIIKMVVHPDARRKGVGRALLSAAIDYARRTGKTLVTLDTRTEDAAEQLYASVGFDRSGTIPDFALDPDGGRRHATTYMYLRIPS